LASFHADAVARRIVAAADNYGDRLTPPNARLIKLHSNFNHIGVRSFVLSGAPKSTPLRTKLRTLVLNAANSRLPARESDGDRGFWFVAFGVVSIWMRAHRRLDQRA